MLPFSPQQQAAIHRLCVKHRVARLELFGSAARTGDFDPAASDLDFLVDFLSLPEADYADVYFGLREDLADLLGREVDLVMTQAIRNPYFRQAVDRDRTQVYAA
ncbi:MAG: nucleotidyltransferase domain-containing protein [Pseudomonadota bacterium]